MRDVETQRKRNRIKKHAGGKIGRFYVCIDKERFQYLELSGPYHKGLEVVSNDMMGLPALSAIVPLQGAFVVALMKADVQAVDGDALYF